MKLKSTLLLCIGFFFLCIGCSSNDEIDPTPPPTDPDLPGITLEEGQPDELTTYADDEQANVYIKFNARSPWAVKVTETTSKSTEPNETDWLRLLSKDNDTEIYQGNPGAFELRVVLDINYTGKDREAQIELQAGTNKIYFKIIQKAITEIGEIPEKIPVTDIMLNNYNLQLAMGAFKTLRATIEPEEASDKRIIWKSDNEEIATVDPVTGKVTGVRTGETLIIATARDDDAISASCQVTVIADFNILTEEHTPDPVLRAWLNETLAQAGGIYTASQAASYNGTLDFSWREGTLLDKITSYKGLEFFTSVEELIFNNNKRSTELDFSGNTMLKKLKISSFVYLSTVNISENLYLEELDMDVQITELDVTNKSELRRLNLGQVKIQTLDLSKNTKLEELSLSDLSNLGGIDLSNNHELTKLEAVGTPLENINIQNCTKLTYLMLNGSRFEEIDLSPFLNLDFLWISNNPNIKKVDVTYNTRLQFLLVTYCNLIEKLEVSHLADLEHLMYNSNNIAQQVDISNNPLLEELNCSYNPIEEIDISQNRNLKRLYCDYTQIKELDISNCENLQALWAQRTPLETLYVWPNFDASTLNATLPEGVNILPKP